MSARAMYVVVATLAASLVAFTGLSAAAPASVGPVANRALLASSYPDLVDLTGRGTEYGTIDISAGRRGHPAAVSLVSAAGRTLWSTAIPHQQAYAGRAYPFHPDGTSPGLIAAGDFTGDGTTDYVLKMTWPTAPALLCGGIRETWSQLLFVDGKTGRSSRPVPPLEDRCFDFPSAHVSYPKQHWGGMVAIGPFAGSAANDVVAMPTYPSDNRGFVLHFDGTDWRRVTGRSRYLDFPSDPGYGAYYDSVNTTPCRSPFSAAPSCYVLNSHVPLGVFLDPLGTAGLFAVTSGRALVYRPDLTPTSDTTWTSGTTSNAGRNYGYLVEFTYRGGNYVELIGGCSIRVERDAMRSGQLPSGSQATSLRGGDAHCGIHHHFEWFHTAGSAIVGHVNRYYSFSETDGFFHSRPEFPGNPAGPVGGRGSMWTVFNVYQAPVASSGAGRWHLQMFSDPEHPDRVIDVPGWYVWDVIDLHHDGRAELLATRAPGNGYILPWQFDVLEFKHGALVSTRHVAGAVPALVKVPNTATRYELGDALSSFAAATVPLSATGGRLMVEDRNGHRHLMSLVAGRKGSSSGVLIGGAGGIAAALAVGLAAAARRRRLATRLRKPRRWPPRLLRQ